MAERKSKSPYQRYQKTPIRYSEAYNRWKSATKGGREAEARAAAYAHRRFLISTFGPSYFEFPDPDRVLRNAA